MRPGQNKRMRGRPNNNRRGPNPLTRSYESNGPDVKIRGNAHHVAEKYLQLARDAHTSGDPVAAENYLQHAEHYFRLIASAQAAQLQAQSGAPRAPGEESDEMDDDDDVGGPPDRFASPAERVPAPAPNPFPNNNGFAPAGGASAPQQAYQDRPPYESERAPTNDRPPYGNDRGGYQARNDRPNQNRHPQDRGARPDRPFQDRSEGRDNRDNRGQRDGRPRDFRPYREPNQPRDAPAPAEAPQAAVLPSFITAPPRVATAPEADEPRYPASEQVSHAPGFSDSAVSSDAPQFASPEEPERGPIRGRRRRPRPQFGFDAPEKEPQSEPPALREESNSTADD
jgi:hypothetical protein